MLWDHDPLNQGDALWTWTMIRVREKNFLTHFFTWRGGPSGWNSLCKNLKKQEKMSKNGAFFVFFMNFGEIFYRDFQVKIADFLWIFIKNGLKWAIFGQNRLKIADFLSKMAKNGLISGKYWLNSVKFHKGVVQDLGSKIADFEQFQGNYLQFGFKMDLIWK